MHAVCCTSSWDMNQWLRFSDQQKATFWVQHWHSGTIGQLGIPVRQTWCISLLWDEPAVVHGILLQQRNIHAGREVHSDCRMETELRACLNRGCLQQSVKQSRLLKLKAYLGSRGS